MAAATLAGLELETRFAATDDVLTIDYRLRNTTQDRFYVLDRMFKTDATGRRSPLPRSAYVLIENGDTVHVTCSGIRVPPGLKVEIPEVPYARLLDRLAELHGNIVLPLPLRPTDPYRRRGSADDPVRHVGRVCLSLGVVPATADLVVKPMSAFGDGVVSIAHTRVLQRQVLVRSPLEEMPLAVRG